MSPKIESCWPGFSADCPSCLAKAGYKIFLIKEVFPLPLTPVTMVSTSRGICTSTCFRLLARHPANPIKRFQGLDLKNTPMDSSFRRYWAVRLFDFFFSWGKVPENTTSPPRYPASGPISIKWSAAFIKSASCSTTIQVLPSFLNCWITAMRRWVSLGCRPMLGSSKMYIEPTKLLPSEVARLMRWDSPPDKVFDTRFRVK